MSVIDPKETNTKDGPCPYCSKSISGPFLRVIYDHKASQTTKRGTSEYWHPACTLQEWGPHVFSPDMVSRIKAHLRDLP